MRWVGAIALLAAAGLRSAHGAAFGEAQAAIILCLKPDVTAPDATEAMVEGAARSALGLSADVPVKASLAVDVCTANAAWQARISVWNTATAVNSASGIASAQVDGIYYNRTLFFRSMSTGLTDAGATNVPDPSQLTLESLGYLVVWLDGTNGSSGGTTGGTSSNDTLEIGGTTVYWPGWMWAVYVAVVVCLVCPCMGFIFAYRRKREVEEEADAQAAQPKAMSDNEAVF
ncbi:hypothetical protein JKP88DRAFT_349882 [Tribonema minus]|uniref:Uncharacterized protein n=1 Tax=Tribonema minus TaxID=303371 RepID=A0A835YQ20_9STRA|nr:hypothetical protein JKP88DRAFT_349882 [Tribonema minus]